jgi:hypothetical protein
MAAVELRELSAEVDSQNDMHDDIPIRDSQQFSLPPADTGIRAWMFLAGSFFVEALVWGE